jgi:hypothetical protein
MQHQSLSRPGHQALPRKRPPGAAPMKQASVPTAEPAGPQAQAGSDATEVPAPATLIEKNGGQQAAEATQTPTQASRLPNYLQAAPGNAGKAELQPQPAEKKTEMEEAGPGESARLDVAQQQEPADPSKTLEPQARQQSRDAVQAADALPQLPLSDKPGARSGPAPAETQVKKASGKPAPATAAPGTAAAGAAVVAASAPQGATAGPAAGGGGSAAAETPTEQEEQAKTEDRVDAAEPEREEDDEAAPIEVATSAAEAAGAAGGGAAAASSPSETASDGDEGGGSPVEVPAEPTPQAADSQAAHPEAMQRQQEHSEQREQQAEGAAHGQHEAKARESDQLDQDVEAGQVSGEIPGAELSGPEREAALGSLGEELPAEGGGQGEEGAGAGGGGPAQAQPEQAPPDVSALPPEQGLATLASASPAQADAGLVGVQGAAARENAEQTQAVQQSLPETTVGEPAGPPAAGPQSGEAAGVTAAGTPPAAAGAAAGRTQLAPTPAAPAGNAADKVARPQIAKPAQGAEPSAADQARVAGAVAALPTSDPGLNVSLGEAPSLALSGGADPAQLAAQKAQADQAVAASAAREAAAVAKPMGEQNLRPTVGQAQIKARTIGAAGGAGGGAPSTGGAGAAAGGGAQAILAEELKGPEVRQALVAAAAKAGAAKSAAQAQVAASNAEAEGQIGELKAQAASDQEAARAHCRTEAQAARSQHAQQQQRAVAGLAQRQAATLAKTEGEVGEAKRQGEDEAAAQIAQGEQETSVKRSEVETAVAAKKREAQAATEEKGFFGWLADDVGAWFDRQKQWISDKVEAGKTWIRDTAERFKQYAAARIDAARDRVVGLIVRAGTALLTASDALLADFPAARAAVQSTIMVGMAMGIAKVNSLAEDAKREVNRRVDRAASLAEKALDKGGKLANAAIDHAKATTVGALNAADKAAQALGVLKVLVEDVAADPGAWVSKLGAAAKDGVRNHLAGAMKAAIKQWWEGKVESVLGVGQAVWATLKAGGLGLKQIGAMAWSAIKAAIPPALIQLVIEKVVAMIIPAAGAVLAVIEGLQAAWGSVSAMLGAVGRAIAFLKAVKGGGAGAQFAQLVAAAAIVVIDFVSNWLLARLGKAILKIGSKIKGIAQKLIKKISGALKKFKAKRRAGKRAKARKKASKRDPSGKKKDANQKKQDKSAEQRKRLDAAVQAIRPKLAALLSKGVSRARLKIQLLLWRVQHGLTMLSLQGKQVVAKVNPESPLDQVESADLGMMLEPILQAAEQRFLTQYKQSRTADDFGMAGYRENPDYVKRSKEVDDVITMRSLIEREGMAPDRIGHHKVELASTGVSVSVGDVGSLASGKVPMGPYPSYASTDAHWQKAGAPQIGALGPGHRSLMLLERARHKGMLPAMDVVQSMGQLGELSSREMVTGHLNPMRREGAGMAGTIDSFHDGQPHRPLSKKERQQVAEGRQSRHESVGDIFKRLSHAAAKEKGVLVKGGEQAKPLRELATAVEQWVASHLQAKAGDAKAAENLAATTAALVAQFVVFLKSFRG